MGCGIGVKRHRDDYVFDWWFHFIWSPFVIKSSLP
jgi:hypothetical protein